jgi:hypothetical protein
MARTDTAILLTSRSHPRYALNVPALFSFVRSRTLLEQIVAGLVVAAVVALVGTFFAKNSTDAGAPASTPAGPGSSPTVVASVAPSPTDSPSQESKAIPDRPMIPSDATTSPSGDADDHLYAHDEITLVSGRGFDPLVVKNGQFEIGSGGTVSFYQGRLSIPISDKAVWPQSSTPTFETCSTHEEWDGTGSVIAPSKTTKGRDICLHAGHIAEQKYAVWLHIRDISGDRIRLDVTSWVI